MAEASHHEAPPVLNLIGEKVALGPLRHDLLPLYLRWINRFEAVYLLGLALRPLTAEAEEAWYESVARRQDNALFTIYERTTLRPIGNGGLREIDHSERTANFGIFIGETDCWNKGYGTEATTLILDYAFTALGLHNVVLGVFDYNERAMRAYTKAGFRVIGRRREARRLAGRAHDVILMDCLASEFQSPVLRRLLAPDADGRM